jgi:Predicted nucleic acid-binding protein, contains PIN domain
VEHQPSAAYWHEISYIADRYNLTIYDAAYLELALRRQLPLATFDKALLAAARAEGIEVLP